MMRLAVIDIGTLTCRLLVAEVSPDGLMHTIDTRRNMVRLGEGVDRTGQLAPAAMARVIETMLEWKTVIGTCGVDRYAAVATSAVRDARNRDEFVEKVKHATGVEVEVLDGAEEARRTCLGIRSGLPSDVRDMLGLDIGGGSTEFIVSRHGQAPRVASMQMGVVRLTERVLHGDPPRSAEIHEAETLVRDLTRDAFREVGDVTGLTLVGTAGTITSLAAMAQALPAYDPARIHRYLLTVSEVRRIERNVFGATRAERVGMPGLETGREEVMAAGTLMLRCIMHELNMERCVVSEFGLREGVVGHLARSCLTSPGPSCGVFSVGCTSGSPEIPDTRGGESRRVFPEAGP